MSGDQFKIVKLPKIAGCKYLVLTAAGDYVGTVECEYLSPVALDPLAALLRQVADQQGSRVQVAPANAVPDIQTKQ